MARLMDDGADESRPQILEDRDVEDHPNKTLTSLDIDGFRTPQTSNPTPANSSRKRRHVPNLSRPKASPSHAQKMSMLFRNASEELRNPSSPPTLATPNVRASRSPLAEARFTKFGQSPPSRIRKPYSYRSPPKKHLSPSKGSHTYRNAGEDREPLSRGYVAYAASPSAWDLADNDKDDLSYPTLPDVVAEASTSDIHTWLDGVNESSYSPTKAISKPKPPKTGAEDINSRTPSRAASDKENISPTHSLSPIRPPIIYSPVSTPSRFCPLSSHQPAESSRRLPQPCISRGALSLPPRRRRQPKKPANCPNEDSSSSTSSDPPPQLPMATPMIAHEDPDVSEKQEAIPVQRGRDFSIPTSALSAALATLSPAVSVKRRGRPGKGTDAGAFSKGRVVSEGPVLSHPPVDDNVGEKRVLRSGRVVNVLNESELSEQLCKQLPFLPEAESKAFEFVA